VNKQRNYGCRITECSIQGYKVVVLENSSLRISVLVGMGAGIFELLYKPTDTDFMYRDNLGFERLNGFIPTVRSDKGNYWDYNIGGWYELFPNSGGATEIDGAQIGRHGEVILVPWEYSIIEDSQNEIRVKFTANTIRTPFMIERTISLNNMQSALFIEEKLTNKGKTDMPFLWGHHVTFGNAFINQNCLIRIPEGKIYNNPAYIPSASRLKSGAIGSLNKFPGKSGEYVDLSKIPPQNSKVAEMLFIDQLENSWFTVADMEKGIGFALTWDEEMFDSLWFCEEFEASTGYPFYGNAYYLALEPQVSKTPRLSNAIKDGSAKTIKAGQTLETWLTAVVYQDIRNISDVKRSGELEFIE